MTDSQHGPDLNVKTPKRKAPAGACDCHMHIFGPLGQYSLNPARAYTPKDASIPQYLAMCDVLGLERTVVVHPSVYGNDNSRSLDAVREMGPNRARGVAVIDATTGDDTLKELDAAGFRGIRINVLSGGGTPVEQIDLLARRIAPMGWHIQFYIAADMVAELAPTIGQLPVEIVLDHIGGMRQGMGLDHPGFQATQRLLDGGRAWLKLSGAYRVDDGPAPWPAATPFAEKLVANFPERLVWGTDWPHPHLNGPIPNDGDLMDLLLGWVPDEATLTRILVENPARLYDFG